MLGMSDNLIQLHENSFYDNFYKKYLNQGDVIYDIGAYRGVLSRKFAQCGYKVIAIEGSPDNFEFLKRNTEGYKNIEIYNVGLHERSYKVRTKFNDCNAPLGMHSEQEISYVTLDEYMETLPIPKLVKMDIEGMESVVLKKSEKLINEVKPIWQLSLHPDHMGYSQDYPGWVSKENGGFNFDKFFELYNVFNTKMEKLNSFHGFDEYLLLPKEKFHV